MFIVSPTSGCVLASDEHLPGRDADAAHEFDGRALRERRETVAHLARRADRAQGIVLVRSCGIPNTATTASPMNFSTRPPCRSTAVRIASK